MRKGYQPFKDHGDVSAEGSSERRMDWAVRRLQRAAKSMLTRKQSSQENKEQENAKVTAALRIQKAARGMFARVQYNKLRMKSGFSKMQARVKGRPSKDSSGKKQEDRPGDHISNEAATSSTRTNTTASPLHHRGAGDPEDEDEYDTFNTIPHPSHQLPIVIPDAPGSRSSSSLFNGFLITVWFLCSGSLALYNKHLLGSDRVKFPAPLLMTAVQFFFQGSMAAATWHIYFRNFYTPPRPPTSFDLPNQPYSEPVFPRIPWAVYIQKVAPVALSFAIDIGLSNWSLVFVTVSFYTMCKASAPMFLLFFAFLMGLEAPTLRLVAVIATICTGVLLTVAGETKFHWFGFILVMIASSLAGLRWALSQVLLQSSKIGLDNPLAAMSYMMPLMSVTLLFMSLIIEPLSTLSSSPFFDTWHNSLGTLCLIAIGAVLAFVMTLAEFQLLQNTSALTVMILGVCKEVGTICAAVLFYGDELSWVNCSGLVLVFCGVLMFKSFRSRQKKLQESRHVIAAHEANEMIKDLESCAPPEEELAEEEVVTSYQNSAGASIPAPPPPPPKPVVGSVEMGYQVYQLVDDMDELNQDYFEAKKSEGQLGERGDGGAGNADGVPSDGSGEVESEGSGSWVDISKA